MSFVSVENFEEGVEKLGALSASKKAKVMIPFEVTRLMGPPVVLALMVSLKKEFPKLNLSFYVDCGEMPGLVLSLLRGNQKILSGIRFKKSSKTYTQVKDLCRSASVALI